MTQLKIIATTPMGLEAVVAREVRELGYEQMTVENGRVVFAGDLLAVCRANLWLRSADRVLVQMAQFKALTFEELFEGVKAVDWSAWIPGDGQFPVEGRSHKSQLSSVPACQSIVKKAVVEKMKQSYATDWFAEDGAKHVIEVALLNDIATITLDTTGPGLHKRGYRKQATEVPIKETMAAAIVQLSRWRPGRPMYDPFCGSGTMLIEAAMIGWNIAPGLRRTFDAESWAILPPKLWREAREEAFDLVRDDEPLELTGSDLDGSAIDIAVAAAKSAGLGNEIRFLVQPVKNARPTGDYGCLLTNPPYGERLGSQEEVEQAIRQLGVLAKLLPTWSFFAISPNKQFEHQFGRPADKKRKLFNGRIECQLYQYLGPLPPRRQD